MLDVSTAAFLASGHDRAILVNGDSATLPTEVVEQAIAALRAPGDRVVLGPALDGGNHLAGLERPHPRLFPDIAWSTPEVLACTLRRAEEIGLPATLLPMWYDVDEAQDFLTPPRSGLTSPHAVVRTTPRGRNEKGGLPVRGSRPGLLAAGRRFSCRG